MTLVLSVTCDGRHTGAPAVHPTTARGDGAARAHAAVHGWTSDGPCDYCPSCSPAHRHRPVPAPSRPTTDRLAAVAAVLAGPALPSAADLEAGRHPATAPTPVVYAADDAVLCQRCDDGDHWLCSGCACPAAAHGGHR